MDIVSLIFLIQYILISAIGIMVVESEIKNNNNSVIEILFSDIHIIQRTFLMLIPFVREVWISIYIIEKSNVCNVDDMRELAKLRQQYAKNTPISF